MSILLAAMAFVACQEGGENNLASGEQSRVVAPEVMEQFLADLQAGVFHPGDVEDYRGEECAKAFGELHFGTQSNKFGNYGTQVEYIFYEGGECRVGYDTIVYGPCNKTAEGTDHPYLYHSMTWSCNVAEGSITICSPERKEQQAGYTLKVLEYKDGKFLLSGALPMTASATEFTLKYRGWISSATESRQAFEEKYQDENNHLCCKQ